MMQVWLMGKVVQSFVLTVVQIIDQNNVNVDKIVVLLMSHEFMEEDRGKCQFSDGWTVQGNVACVIIVLILPFVKYLHIIHLIQRNSLLLF